MNFQVLVTILVYGDFALNPIQFSNEYFKLQC
jgi:hypothetical protein